MGVVVIICLAVIVIGLVAAVAEDELGYFVVSIITAFIIIGLGALIVSSSKKPKSKEVVATVDSSSTDITATEKTVTTETTPRPKLHKSKPIMAEILTVNDEPTNDKPLGKFLGVSDDTTFYLGTRFKICDNVILETLKVSRLMMFTHQEDSHFPVTVQLQPKGNGYEFFVYHAESWSYPLFKCDMIESSYNSFSKCLDKK